MAVFVISGAKLGLKSRKKQLDLLEILFVYKTGLYFANNFFPKVKVLFQKN